MHWSEVSDRYFEYPPLEDKKNILSLNEGNTPLIRARWIEVTVEKEVKE